MAVLPAGRSSGVSTPVFWTVLWQAVNVKAKQRIRPVDRPPVKVRGAINNVFYRDNRSWETVASMKM